jgi:cytochrome c biogenesis protein CcmG, thiol:disulfide interchange protein DsbE
MNPQRRWIFIMPLVCAALLAALFFYGLRSTRNPQEIKSILIDKPAPAFDLPSLDGQRFTNTDLAKNRVVIVNFFASWCVPCRAEHPQLMQLAKRYDIPVYGIAWRDSAENAADFLKQLGNPYTDVGIDASGRMGINWGVAGVPETFVVTPNGKIGFRHWGDIRTEHIEARLLPAIRALEPKK